MVTGMRIDYGNVNKKLDSRQKHAGMMEKHMKFS
jgi:exonuclease III